MQNSQFTSKDALKIQAKQLKDYEYRLKPEMYAKLKKWIDLMNQDVNENPNTVVRGTDIQNFVSNNLRPL